MHCAAILAREFAKVKQVQKVITFSPKARLPIVAALDEVHGNTGQNESKLARHDP